jgi:hypothetical protein
VLLDEPSSTRTPPPRAPATRPRCSRRWLKAFLTDLGFRGQTTRCRCVRRLRLCARVRHRAACARRRIALIYEGTNEIQAIDLVMRKLRHGPAAFEQLRLLGDAELPFRVADDLLRATGLALVAQAWARADAVSSRPQHAGDAFHRAKCESAAHCFVHLRPEFEHALAQARAGWQPLARLAPPEAA